MPDESWMPFGNGSPRPMATGGRSKSFSPAIDVLPNPCASTVSKFVEKLLKALLTRHAVEAPRTHDLRRLIQLAEPFAPVLLVFANRCDDLTVHGVQSRYPDDWVEVTAIEMNEMVALSRELGDILKSLLRP